MKLSWKIAAITGLSVALSLLVSLAQAQNGVAPAPGAGQGEGRGCVMDPIDRRVQQRSVRSFDVCERQEDPTGPRATWI